MRPVEVYEISDDSDEETGVRRKAGAQGLAQAHSHSQTAAQIQAQLQQDESRPRYPSQPLGAPSRSENIQRRDRHVMRSRSPSRSSYGPSTAHPREAVIVKANMTGPPDPMAPTRPAASPVAAPQRGTVPALGQEPGGTRSKGPDYQKTPPRAPPTASGHLGSARKGSATARNPDGSVDSIVAREAPWPPEPRAAVARDAGVTGDTIEAKEASAPRPVEPRRGFAPAQPLPRKPTTDASERSPSTLTTPKKAARAAADPGADASPRVPNPISPQSIEVRLRGMIPQIRRDHARLAVYCIENSFLGLRESQRHVSATDHFLDMRATEVDVNVKDHFSMKVKLKQHGREHGKGKVDNRLCRYRVICIKTDKQAVPPYRFHHVDIQKNILTPNAMLKFIPHLRDMEASEEKIFQLWVHELQEMDQKSGFNTLKQQDRVSKIKRDELAATVFLYLDQWLEDLDIGCSRETLLEYLTRIEDPEDEAVIHERFQGTMAQKFTVAFGRAFRDKLSLRDVLRLDENWENWLDKARAADDPNTENDTQKTQQKEPLLKAAEDWLTSYTSLGCLICFNHSCEHGEYMHDNHRRAYSLDQMGGLDVALKKRRARARRKLQLQHASPRYGKPSIGCPNRCYTQYGTGNQFHAMREWKDSERMLLKTMFLVLEETGGIRPQCLTAMLLDRPCFETHREMQRLELKMPPQLEAAESLDVGRSGSVKQLSWYDRTRKVLLGDWKDHTKAYEAPRFESHDPCIHDGPCTIANGCGCAKLGVFCEHFCRCEAETCPLKFTGCACHGSGKTCVETHRQGARPCICILLNRECDPVLCQGCGVRERADPENRFDEVLHATGCQNCALQRAVSKPVCLGESQLDGCGYGLFTAVDIAEGEFILEYVGELIEHDEGVRREARRGNVFDESENVSYLFTLLEDDGIWVDAAVYGNLSRYMNHAEQGKKSCNVVPKIVYVNGEFRIRFTAQRDIKAGEELFFNYGENFPNLTKKRLEDKAEDTNGADAFDMAAANGGDEDDFESATVAAPKKGRPRKKPGPKPSKGKRGGARPGAGRKPNSAKNLGAVQQTKSATGAATAAAAAAPKVRKKPGPKPRQGARKEAPPSKPLQQAWGHDEQDFESDRGTRANSARDDDGGMDEMEDDNEEPHQTHHHLRQRRTLRGASTGGTRRSKRKLEEDEEDDDYEDGGGSDSNTNSRGRPTRRAAKRSRGDAEASSSFSTAPTSKRQKGAATAPTHAFNGATTTSRFVYTSDAYDFDDHKPSHSRHATAESVAAASRTHSVEIADSVEGSARLDDNGNSSSGGDDEEDEDEDEDDVVDRSRRNRRRPARYE
ncbi:hypothetical protein MAPG_00406 [Magnaporthiopsis poae ATCC 64411]|uniref:SET domain-containing protein n=1 Tax=Magnaporthiopsis poae (strain ATCC 64411 / 73-15) TaxID=644358 RepID=A0A0C4DKX4_MAGP6|nr:hypothetical protein MAPG_00406 [Magnaporthiopsis poae ATCC 64411]